MAEPTIRMRTFSRTSTVVSLDTAAERKSLAGASGVSTLTVGGGGTTLDFGTVDISGGAADSLVFYLDIDWTADGGNTQVDTFKLWQATDPGFDQAGSLMKFQPIQGADGTPVTTEDYIVNAVVGSYTWATLPESGAKPGATNVFPTDEGTSMVLSTTSDDAILVAFYAAIAASETTGTYTGTVSGMELQFSFEYAYS